MKTFVAVGLLVLSAVAARAEFTVELDGGDRMTVDSYWEEGDRAHLVQGGVDMTVPKSRVRSVHKGEAADAPAPVAAPRKAAPTPAPEAEPQQPAADDSDATREDLERKQRGIEKHLLRVQAARFESEARGDNAKETQRLDKEFKRTQNRRVDVIHQLRDMPE